MIIAANIKKMLDAHHIAYRVIHHSPAPDLAGCATAADINKAEVLRAEILADSFGEVMVVLPLNRKLDSMKLKTKLHRNLQQATNLRSNLIFTDCELGVCPPFGVPYGLNVVIDSSIENLDYIYFQGGGYTSLIQIATDDFLYLNNGAQRLAFAGEELCFTDQKFVPRPPLQFGYEELTKAFTLPSLPNVARKILQLNMAQRTSISELAQIIASDPAIQQQILSFAKLPFWRVTADGTMDNITDVIQHVLGFDRVSHIAVGVSAGKVFADQQQLSAIEQHSFWSHALCCAALAEAIAVQIAEKKSVEPYLCYVSGLLHNFGLLLFNQLFPEEFKILKKWLKINPRVPITLLENRLIGMEPRLYILRGGHARLGEWLLKYWGMPEVVCVVAKEHHHPNYSGTYSTYVRIIWLANRILKNYGIGDGTSGNISREYLLALGLTLEELDNIVSKVMAEAGELNNLADTLVNVSK